MREKTSCKIYFADDIYQGSFDLLHGISPYSKFFISIEIKFGERAIDLRHPPIVI